MRSGTIARALLSTLLAVPILAVVAGPAVADAPGPQQPLPNPDMAESCGADVALVLDASGSIQSSHAVDDVRDAGEAFLDALADTGSTARVLQFASVSEQLAAQSEVTTDSMRPGGSFRRAIDDYYDPLPPRPAGVNLYQYRGGNPQSSGSYRESNSSTQYTNWDQSLDQAGAPQPRPTELVVYVTDGDPTAFDFNQPGDPFDHGPPPDVAISTDSGSAATTTLDRAVQEANQIKASGARMLAVGVGSAVTGNPSSRSRLEKIAGPQTVDDDDLDSIDSINDVDVALVQNFDALAGFLRGVVNELCTPSLTIRKLAQTADDASYAPAQDWDMTVTPTVDGGAGSWEWILPDTDPEQAARCGDPTDPNDEAPRTCGTNSSGLASFQWEPDPSDALTSAEVVETPQAGFTEGRPDDSDWKCVLKNEDGSQEVEEGELGDGGPADGFAIDVDPQQIITCSIWNSFDYEPAIALDKTDAPTQVRGDLAPPDNTVTSTFDVTNPGNTPLTQVAVVDDHCEPVYTSGDDGDDLLAAGNAETWVYTCTRDLSAEAGSDPLSITNNAEVSGTDPTGQTVFATDDDTVSVYAPAVDLTKTASPTEVEVGVPTDVDYTYVATNTGNLDLTDVTVADAGGPSTCDDVSPASVPLLAPGDSATFTCTVAGLTATDPADTFVDTATVTGDPVFPGGAPAPPAVTAEADAVVTAFQLGLDLTKSVDHTVVLPDTDVLYTYVATNTGSAALVRPADNPAPPLPADPRDGWVVDTIGPTGTCADVDYLSGDTDDDLVLDSGESWTFQCATTIDGAVDRVVDTASIVGEEPNTSARLTALAPALVEVVHPEITLDKTAVRPVVVDPDAPILFGPDAPTPRPASFEYLLTNTGNVPVRNVDLEDVYPTQGGNACPVEPVPAVGANAGDVDGDGSLDPGESWQYQCVLDTDPLRKSDADDPPGADPLTPAVVTNTAVASGDAFIESDPTVTSPVESNPATAQVRVSSPAVQLTKTPCVDDDGTLTCDDDLLVRPGEDVTYRYLVANVGDAPFRPIAGFDDHCDVVDFIGGDTNGNGLLDPGPSAETWEYHCTAPANPPSPVVDNAEVAVIGLLGNVYGDTASASVRIFDPAIHLTKEVSDELVPAGSEVTYTFQVTNEGSVLEDGLPADVVLHQIRLRDVSHPANPTCRAPTFVGGDANGNDELDVDPPETWTYRCTARIDQFTIDAAGVVGRDIQDGRVFDFAGAAVTPFVTGIDVTKVADPTELGVGGGTTTYTYVVTNTGNVPLQDVTDRITDDTCPNVVPVEADGFNVGDVDHNDLLTSVGDLFETGGFEQWEFQCTVDLTETTVNTVTVLGTPVRPFVDDDGAPQVEVLADDVTDQAQATVTVAVESGTLPANEVPFLPPTGAELIGLAALAAIAALGTGVGFRAASRRIGR